MIENILQSESINVKNVPYQLSRRFDDNARAWYNRKSAKKNFMVAHSALSSKLARAAYYIMKNNVPFDPGKLFA